ncbi:hypothetical protein CMK11_05540 [Candidatus Poribacteria bacterium]|nr:hypothetical protein [Candidatus Poribacteria bacterium]
MRNRLLLHGRRGSLAFGRTQRIALTPADGWQNEREREMPILLGTPKLGPDTKLGMPVGIWYMQIDAGETTTPDFQAHLEVIQRPLAQAAHPYIACERFIVSDVNRGAPPESASSMATPWKGLVQGALDLNDSGSYDIKLSVGYIVKLFRESHYANHTLLEAAIKVFVDDICTYDRVDEVVRTWHVIDEPVAKPPDDVDVTWGEAGLITRLFHKHQVANGKNWPFIYVELAPGRSKGDVGTDPNWWKIESGAGWSDRIYDPGNVEVSDDSDIPGVPGGIGTDAEKIQKFVDEIGGAAWSPAPTVRPKLILAPDYYSWASNHWAHTVGPPWRKWRQIYDWWNALTVTGYSSVALPFHALMEGGAQSLDEADPFVKTKLPGHIDMHNMIRMVKEYGMQGVYFWGWSTGSTTSDDPKLTKSHWADGTSSPQSDFVVSGHDEKWGEAVSTEMCRNVPTVTPSPPEFYSDAVPGASRLVLEGTDNLAGAVADTSTSVDGYWIRFSLAASAKVYFRIKRKAGDAVVRILDWGFRRNSTRPTTTISTSDLYEIAPGRYWNLVSSNDAGLNRRPGYPQPEDGDPPDIEVSGDMNGTAQFWDLRDYNNQVITTSGTYVIEMYVDGSPLTDTLEVEIPLP